MLMIRVTLQIGVIAYELPTCADDRVGAEELNIKLKVDDYSLFCFIFLRHKNSQHFNEDLLAVNASAFSFVLCFKAIDYAGASNYVINAN